MRRPPVERSLLRCDLPAAGRGSGRSGGWFVDQKVAGAVRVDRDARAHGGGEVDLLQVTTLRRRWLAAHHLVERSGIVLHQLLGVDRYLADNQVEVRLLVPPKVDL